MLSGLDRQDGFLEGLIWYFQMHFIDLMGYKPTWDSCLNCLGTLGQGASYFQPQNGGLLCHSCGSSGGGLAVDSETLEILYWMQGCRIEDVLRLEPQPGQKANIRKMFDLYFRSHIEHLKGLRSLMLFYQMETAA
jgi:DNA repair protein RecO